VKQVSTDKAPAAIGPYSQAITAGGFLFTAGQLALDPATGQLVAGDVTQQPERGLTTLEAVVAAAGVTCGEVVKTTVYLQDLAHFPIVNELYGKRLGAARPARSTVQVSGLPRGALVEIDAIAVVK